MTVAGWYLTTWEQHHRFPQTKAIIVHKDPSRVMGQRGTFGPALFFPYTLPEEKNPSPFQLLSLEGWMGWSGEGDSNARLPIPTQAAWPGQLALQVALSDGHIEAIASAKTKGYCWFVIDVTGK